MEGLMSNITRRYQPIGRSRRCWWRAASSRWLSLAIIFGVVLFTLPVLAQTRTEILRQVSGKTINTLDPTTIGATRESLGFSVNIYDRLVSFGRRKLATGFAYEFSEIRGEIAESYEVSLDGKTITFKLRENAKFHDGSPITAADVKWSLDRAVTAKTLSRNQMKTGSMTDAGQFKIIDDLTFEVSLDRADGLALPNLAVHLAPIYNSKLALQHATAADPWAREWLKTNTAASGAYMVESFVPGARLVLRRNDNWTSRPKGSQLPFFKQVIFQTVPEAATRANLVERGDADISIDLMSTDVIALEKKGVLSIVSIPQYNTFTAFAFNTRMAPFDNAGVRRAIAFATPYDDMLQGAIAGRAGPLYGATWQGSPTDEMFPQPMPFQTDLGKAKALLTEAGYPNGLAMTLSYNLGGAERSDPMAALFKESLAKIGVDVTINKLPDSQMSEALAEKSLPFIIARSSANFPKTDYFFRIFLQGESRWNYSSWKHSEVDKLIAESQFEPDKGKYKDSAIKLIALATKEVPMIMLWQPNLDSVMAADITGFTYWFHRQVDYRDMRRN
jgi:peptide/nickel transport system substrate-binding protein